MSMLSVQAQRLAEDGLSHSEIEAHLVRGLVRLMGG